MKSRSFCIMAALCACVSLSALTPNRTVLLYPDGAPDNNGYTPADEYVEEGTKIFRTSVPRLDLYQPEGEGLHPTILVCPGGAYLFTSTGNEGIDVANFFVPRGYAIAVLKYRMPNGHENIPLEDAQQAMRMLRDSASSWHLATEHIGVMGFSAGGHLAATLLTKFADAATRPDFGVLVYPVITMDEQLTHQGSCHNLLGHHPTLEQRQRWSADKLVTNATPPCLIVVCQDDQTVQVTNSIRFYEALTAHHIPSSMVIVPTGGHGWGFMRHFPSRELLDQAILSFLASHTK